MKLIRTLDGKGTNSSRNSVRSNVCVLSSCHLRLTGHFPTLVGHWLSGKGGNAVFRLFRKTCAAWSSWAMTTADQKRISPLSFLCKKERRRTSQLAYNEVPEQMISFAGIPMKEEWCLEQETRYLAFRGPF